MHKPIRTLVSAAVFSAMATSAAYAGGFSLYTESSPLMTGNFGAGAAAEGADASIGWYNPAGLVLIRQQQVVMGGVGVFPVAKLDGNTLFFTNFHGVPIPYPQTFSGLSGAKSALVPAFHYALPLGENATFGLSIVSPFGLSTDWDPTSPVRYQATFTELLTSNISPEIGGKLSEHFSVGAGLDLQYSQVKFNRIVGIPTILIAQLNPDVTAADSLSYNKGDSFGVGFHAGLMTMFNENHSRIGLNYQSVMRHTFNGYSKLIGPLAVSNGNLGDIGGSATSRSDSLSSAPVTLPDVVTLSGYHDLNNTIALLGSVVYTGWGSIKTLQLNNVVAPSVSDIGVISQVLVNSASPQNYRDTWRASIGANYRLNPKVLLRVGGGFDQSPTNDIDRDVRLPDANRWALSLGAHYQAKPNIGIDVGYTHLFPADKPTINRTDPLGTTSTFNVTASGTAGADLVGAQLVWLMDKMPEAATK